jgi:hypothetical protein
MSLLRSRSKAKTNNRVRSWHASLIRKRSQVLGDVEAPSREAAEAVAVRVFNLSAPVSWCRSTSRAANVRTRRKQT